jgi:hypothetical protein
MNGCEDPRSRRQSLKRLLAPQLRGHAGGCGGGAKGHGIRPRDSLWLLPVMYGDHDNDNPIIMVLYVLSMYIGLEVSWLE